jgi:hypothetical protein
MGNRLMEMFGGTDVALQESRVQKSMDRICGETAVPFTFCRVLMYRGRGDEEKAADGR